MAGIAALHLVIYLHGFYYAGQPDIYPSFDVAFIAIVIANVQQVDLQYRLLLGAQCLAHIAGDVFLVAIETLDVDCQSATQWDRLHGIFIPEKIDGVWLQVFGNLAAETVDIRFSFDAQVAALLNDPSFCHGSRGIIKKEGKSAVGM